jgi:CDP-2,3-bis-(O-geranylgeranyl)-sn-glycerol synthase
MTPPFTRFVPEWNAPISERWLGAHKTAVGATAGVLMALLIAFIQSRIGWNGAVVDYSRWPVIGLALGVGAVGGDLLKSFLKRRRRIPPGARWIPADQLDFVIGAIALIAPFAHLTWSDVVAVLLVSFVADIAVNQVAFRLQIRETPW